jgi:O-acetyl-ADP-ribose deacetylase (regulator of RNase III)
MSSPRPGRTNVEALRTIERPLEPRMIEVIEGDITLLDVDAIVNAANSTLLGGGGVDGAIHRRAGPDLLSECRTLGGAATGEARLTRGYRLKARFVIHCVGPVWHGGTHGEPEALASCYRNAFKLAKDHSLKSIAFPAISTGVYGYPIEPATTIAVGEARIAEKTNPDLSIIFCCFSQADGNIYKKIFGVPGV